MDVAVLFSGGKDSCLALWHAINEGWNIKSLITVRSKNPESYMFHTPNIKWTEIQAKAIRMPIMFLNSTGVKEWEIKDLYKGLKRFFYKINIDALVSGAIASYYQKSRIDMVCKRLGITSLTPLWHKDPFKLLCEGVSLGFKIIITACMAMGLDREWLGVMLTPKRIVELNMLSEKYGFNSALEGGEGETFVLDGPIFHDRIKILKHKIFWENSSGIYVIEDLKLESKK